MVGKFGSALEQRDDVLVLDLVEVAVELTDGLKSLWRLQADHLVGQRPSPTAHREAETAKAHRG